MDDYFSLSILDKYFTSLVSLSTSSASEQVKAYLELIANFQPVLRRADRQITFFGAFKTGKSTLINAILGEVDQEWREKLSSCFTSSLEAYTRKVHRGVTSLGLQTNIEIPRFQLHPSNLNPNIPAVRNTSSALGGLIGASIGTAVFWELPGFGTVIGGALGAWLSRTLFGIDVKQTNLNAVEQAARDMLPSIEARAEQYIDKIEFRLVDFGNSYDPNPQPSPSLKAAQLTKQYYSSLVGWCNEFQKAIKNLKKEVIK